MYKRNNIVVCMILLRSSCMIFVMNAVNAVRVKFLAECKKIPEEPEKYCFWQFCRKFTHFPSVKFSWLKMCACKKNDKYQVGISFDDLFLRSHPCQVGSFHFLNYCALEQNQNRDGAPDLPSLVSGDHHHDYFLRVWLNVNMLRMMVAMMGRWLCQC